jgi:diguanylate cyclase (GGDEF)-like protein/PAS domain S-box-containing protein
MGKEVAGDKYAASFLGVLILSGLYVISRYDYPLFRSLTGMSVVLIAFGISVTVWNSRKDINNNYFLVLGIAFLFVGGLDLLYILTESGMLAFKGYGGSSLSSRLLITARYVQSASFLAAAFFIGRGLRVSVIFIVYTMVTAILFSGTFHWHIFPGNVFGGRAAADTGGTSRLVISVLFGTAIALLIYRRKDFGRRVLLLVLASLVTALCTEAAFLFQKSLHGPLNLLGRFTNVLSFFFVYAAVAGSAGLPNNREAMQGLDLTGEEREEVRRRLDMAPVMIVVINADGAVGLVNKKACDFLGCPATEITGKDWFDFFLPEKTRQERRTVFIKMITGETAPADYYEGPVIAGGGKERIVAWHSTTISDRSGHNTGTLNSGVDITDGKDTEDKLKASRNRLKAITLALGEGVYILDRAGRLVFMNGEAENILGWKEEELTGKKVHQLVHAHKLAGSMHRPDECPVMETANSGKVSRIAEDVFIRKDGTPFPVTLVSTPLRDDGEITGSVVAFRDITVHKRTEEALRRANELLARQATTDALTGIYNRLKFNGLLDMEIRKARRYKVPLALIMFDIDCFKAINDEYGHLAGDSVLQEIVDLVRRNIRDADLFARWGGEEFMILVPENKLRNAVQLAEKLRMKIEAHRFRDVGKVTCSFGVTEFSEDDTAGSFAGKADRAMYAAKEKGRNRTEYC